MSNISNSQTSKFNPDKSTSEVDKECFSCVSPRCQLLFISFAFFFVYTGFNGTQNLESSLEQGPVSGSVSLGMTYAVSSFTCLIAPMIIKVLSPKRTILNQFIITALFCISNIWPKIYTKYPASILLGFGATPMWVAVGKYVTTLAEKHHLLKAENVYGSFNGIFYGIVQATQISGNLISAFVLPNVHISAPTSAPTLSDYYHRFDETEGKVTLPWITKFVLYMSFAVSCVIGFFIFLLFVKRLDFICSSSRFESIGLERGTCSKISATLRLMVRPDMFLMIPIFFTHGIEMSFAFSSLTKDVITTKLGQHHIGYCMIMFGIANTLSSLLIGILSDKVGKVNCISFVFFVQNGCVA